MQRSLPRPSARRRIIAANLLLPVLAALPALAAVEFRHALDDSALDLKPIKGEEFTEAVKSFHETGTNPYNGNAEAIAKGKELYDENCQACHHPDATGGMGPSLVDDVYTNKRANTDVGKFEIIHSGASGAMRSFSIRGMTQDQILHIIAFLNSLKK
jgi:cytochrome c-L